MAAEAVHRAGEHQNDYDRSCIEAFDNFEFARSASGVLTLRFHTNGGAAVFTGTMHADFPHVLSEISEDRDNRVLILTGTGDRLMTDIDGAGLGDLGEPAGRAASP
jgi:enoyl-CoA hydratase/carnithine racemase